MRRCFSLWVSKAAALASPVTINKSQKKGTMQSIWGDYFPKNAQAPLREAAQTRGYKSPLWLTKEAAMELRCYGGLQEGAVPVRVGGKGQGLYYNIEQTVHPDAQPMRSVLFGKIYPGRLQEVLSKHAKERGFQSPLWVTAEQLKKSETEINLRPEIKLKKGEQPIGIRNDNEVTHFYYNLF